MKIFSIALTLTALAAAAPINAQVPVTRLPSGTINTSARVDGSWYPVGRDGSGYQIYERQTRDAYGNIVVQRARRNSNGSMTVISTRTVANRNGDDCTYARSTNSVGDIIFGRTNNTVCEDRGSRIDGGWYQVGRGRDNNSIYERRTRDRNGNLVIQRARRNPNGTFTILNTRYANDNDKQWRKAQRQQEKEYRKEQKEREKEYRKANKGNGHGNGNHRDDDDDRDDDNGYRRNHR
ncbi:MAG: hypothetical protein ACJ772_05680 [Gemmatimonadaceae bacterium]